MSSDDREWYKDFWRRQAGYVERAPFRMSAADVEQHQRLRVRSRWRLVMVAAIALEIAIVLVVYLLRH